MAQVFVAAVITIPIVSVIAFIAYLIYADSQNIELKIGVGLPIPWSVHSRVRRRRAEVELAKTEAELFSERQVRMQKELLYMDFEEERHKKALGMSQEEG